MTTTKPSLVDALAAFSELTIERGPTVREFADRLGLSSSSVASYRLEALREQGWVERIPLREKGESRGWRLTELGREMLAPTTGSRPLDVGTQSNREGSS